MSATRAVDAVFYMITERLRVGGHARTAGFGAFSVNARAARTDRDPRTNRGLRMPELKAGKGLKDALN